MMIERSAVGTAREEEIGKMDGCQDELFASAELREPPC